MMYLRYHVLLILLCAALCGCATIFNGVTQDVPIYLPPGVSLIHTSAIQTISSDSTFSLLKLKRNRDYTLKLIYRDQEMILPIERSFEPGWVVLDIAMAIVPAIIDGITGSWFYFEPVRVRITNDSDSTHQLLASVPIKNSPKRGGVFLVSLGMVGPFDQPPLFFNGGILGFGYQALKNLEFYLTAGGSGSIALTSNSYGTGVGCSAASYFIESRYNFYGNIYATAGGGFTHIVSDSLRYNERLYNDKLQTYYNKYSSHSPVKKWTGAMFGGIGYAGSVGFFELRHTLGFSKIPLPKGEKGVFETTAFYFGLNIRF